MILLLLTSFCLAVEYDIYNFDYPKGSFCSAIGGACAGDTDFDNGFFQNPAALTSQGDFWDFDFDFSDSNSLEHGVTGNNHVTQSTGLGALAVSDGKFGYGISFAQDQTQVDQIMGAQTTAQNYFLSLPLAYALSKNLYLGLSLNAFLHQQSVVGGQIDLKHEPSIGITLGGLYKLNSQWSFGSWLRTPADSHVNRTISLVQDQIGVHMPWIFAIGAGYKPYSDRTSLTFDLDFIGSTSGGMAPNYDTIVHIPKGRDLAVDPRLGFKTPWFKESNGTVLLGLYYATSRTEGFGGTFHVTAGAAYRVLIPWIDSLEFMAALDLAQDYTKVFLTFR